MPTAAQRGPQARIDDALQRGGGIGRVLRQLDARSRIRLRGRPSQVEALFQGVVARILACHGDGHAHFLVDVFATLELGKEKVCVALGRSRSERFFLNFVESK
jgi:hypothetical protein